MIGIIIGVIILSIMLLGISNIIDFSQNTYGDYEEKLYKYIIQLNSNNIIKKLDVLNIGENEIFYVYKDTSTKNFTIFTGEINEEYAYIDKNGKKIDKDTNIGKTYKREFFNKVDVIRYNLNPEYLSGVVFHYDSTNIDGTYNSTLSDNDYISTWNDLVNSYNATQVSAGVKPLYKTGGINVFPYVKFDGINDSLDISNNSDINTGSTYPEKSFALVIKTGNDVNTTQTLYEQGGGTAGYEFKISSGDFTARVWNGTWDKTVNLGEVIINSIYFITIIQDSNTGKLQIYQNGELVNEQTGLSNAQIAHSGNITIGYFGYMGGIGELISWNHALTIDEIRGIQVYFSEKWLRGTQDVIHYEIKNTVSKVKN